MKQDHNDFHDSMEAHDDVVINASGNSSLDNLLDEGRRRLLKGGIGMAALGFLGGGLSACSTAAKNTGATLIGFRGIPPQMDQAFDRVIVADGYTAQAFFSWGDAVERAATPWHADASDDWQAQLLQAGENHDGMHFFPFPTHPNSHGLLVMNHEYVNPTLHPNGMTTKHGKRPLDEVRKEQAAHGVSVIEVKKDLDGKWQRVFPSRFNRRISALTPMRISGPLAGHAAMKTMADPDGLQVLGTINNCSNGYTPWGTYLTCEENWHNYFVNRDKQDYAQRISHKRYGISTSASKNYQWETADPRFDATPDAGKAHGGYVNEPHRFGWVVEIDPFDPDSKPIKRTAFGRYCRECATLSLADDGRMAFYSGDDTRGEYIYKFVPHGRYDARNPEANRHLLDSGILYVAKLTADGSGRWQALVHGENGLTIQNGFASQEDILLNARTAADFVGATPMDRPEWAAVHPVSREVFVTLTNNNERGKKVAVDAANPRLQNLHGQILRFREAGDDPAAVDFKWSIFLLAGERADSRDANGKPVSPNLVGNIKGDIFSSPDGLAFDKDGRLWIQTDYDDDAQEMQIMGCNQLLCADTVTGEVRRFLVGPRGCELTGMSWSPDGRSMWINVQHPGISYPASDGKTRPRSTTVLITRNDGGVIGAA